MLERENEVEELAEKSSHSETPRVWLDHRASAASPENQMRGMEPH